MSPTLRLLLVGLLAGAWSTQAVVRTVYVDVNAAAGGIGTAGSPFDTIAAAVAAINGDGTVGHGEGTVVVAGGTYRSTLSGGKESFGTDGITLTKYMTVKGGYVAGDWSEGTRVARSTDIDLTGAGTRAFYQNVPTHLYRASLLDGLALRNASHGLNGGAVGMAGGWGVGFSLNNCLFENNVTTGQGGAAYITATDAPAQITNCDFISNQAGGYGGALRMDPGFTRPKTISGCNFVDNQGTYGGGVFMNCGANSGVAMTITGCSFASNSASSDGGALYSWDGAGTSLTVSRTSFLRNSAPQGAAVGGSEFWNGDYVLQNCLVAGNTGSYAVMQSGYRTDSYSLDLAYCTIVDNPNGGVYAQWLNHSGPGPDLGLRIRDSIIASNGAVGVNYAQGAGPACIIEYSDVWGQTTDFAGNAFAGTGTISLDPQFVDALNGVYQLLATSPARDTGFDIGIYVDLLGKLRPYPIAFVGPSGFDMGAYEFPEPGSLVLAGLAGLALLARRRRT